MPAAIYIIRNTVNQKVYVGKSVNVARRLSRHRSELIHGKHPNGHLQKAWKKYGAVAFRFEVLELVNDPSCLAALEYKYAHDFKANDPATGYNLDDVDPVGGHAATQETRAKMSAAQKAHFAAHPERAAAVSAALKGRSKPPFSAQHLDNLSIGQTTRWTEDAKTSQAASQRQLWANPEYRERLQKAHTGQRQSEETKAKRRATWAAKKETLL